MMLTVFYALSVFWCVFAIILLIHFAREHYRYIRIIERRLNQPPVAARIIRNSPKLTEKPAANSNSFQTISNPLRAS